MSIDSIPGLWPGEVESYDAEARTCRVRIPGVTDGSSVLPVAVFANPLGDRAVAGETRDHTEIRILPGDPVWLMFECGDPRFPIIIGYRTPRDGNPTGWRRWRHANIEMTADGELVFNAANVTWNISGNETKNIGGNAMAGVGGSSSITASTHSIDATTSITGNTSISGALTNNGTNVGSSHTHGGVDPGSGNTAPPN